MAYVPPHKRLSKIQEGPPPTPAQLLPKFKKNLNLHSVRSGSDGRKNKVISYGKKILYANNSISRWLAVPLRDDVQLPSLCLLPVSLESAELKTGENQLTLVKDRSQEEHHDIKSCQLEDMWASVAASVHADLLSAFQNVRNEMVDQKLEEIKPSIVARFGKVLFRRNSSHNQDYINENLVSESFARNLRKKFYTNVPKEYMEHIKSAIVPMLSVKFEDEKELYHVKLADARRPDSTISCKCRVQKETKKLDLYKIEFNQVRNMVVDISCLESKVDLRLALCTKRILTTTLQEEEVQIIRDLVSLAILDSNVKGGLRWPLGKANSGGQYSIVGVWHTKTEAHSNSSLRVKLREADRFDFLTSTGEVTREISLKLTGINRSLLEQRSEQVNTLVMLEDALKLMRKHFLAWDGSLVSCSS